MIDYEARTQEREKQAKLELARNCVDNLYKQKPEAKYEKIISKVKELLELDSIIEQELYKIYCK